MLKIICVLFSLAIFFACGAGDSQPRYKANSSNVTVQNTSTDNTTGDGSGADATQGGNGNNNQAGSGNSDATANQTPDNSVDGCAAALTSFTTNITPSASCINCHAGTPISGSMLAQGDDEGNRDIFLAFDTTADGSDLYDKISGAVNHGGGVLTGQLSQTAITAWKTAEQGCDEN